MEAKETTYILGLWLTAFSNGPLGMGGDVMVSIQRDDDKPLDWQVKVRFRYRMDDKVWGSKDKESSRCYTVEGMLESEVIQNAESMMEDIDGMFGGSHERVLIQGYYDKLIKMSDDGLLPEWMHLKKCQLTEEEVKAFKATGNTPRRILEQDQ